MHFRYSKNLRQAKDFGIRKGLISGAGMGFLWFVIFASYALAFWYGGKLIREDDYTAGQMLTVSIFCDQETQMSLRIIMNSMLHVQLLV